MRVSRKLTEQDILDILHEYQGEIRKLRVKEEFVKEKIQDLNQKLKDLREAKEHKDKPQVQQERKLAPKAKRVFKLSEWDKMIMNALERANKVLINQEIHDRIQEEARVKGLYGNEKKAKAKLNQCLIKLANRRGDLVKVRFKGRGYAYALPEWMDGRKLKKEYKR